MEKNSWEEVETSCMIQHGIKQDKQHQTGQDDSVEWRRYVTLGTEEEGDDKTLNIHEPKLAANDNTQTCKWKVRVAKKCSILVRWQQRQQFYLHSLSYKKGEWCHISSHSGLSKTSKPDRKTRHSTPGSAVQSIHPEPRNVATALRTFDLQSYAQ